MFFFAESVFSKQTILQKKNHTRAESPRNIIHIDITSEPPTIITPPNNNCIALGSVILEIHEVLKKRESEKKREHIRKRIPIKTLIAPFLELIV